MSSRKSIIRRGEPWLDVIVYMISIAAFIVTIYPFLYVFVMSVSTPTAVLYNKIKFLPDSIYLDSYRQVFSKPDIWMYYYNTIWIAVVGTVLNLIMTVLFAYPLSKKDFKLGKYIMKLMVFTMFFSGGLIPFFIQVNKLGMYNTRWALVIPFALSAWNIIITRTYFKSSIPESLDESAIIDGATRLRILYSIIIPLSKPILAVIALWSAVGFWNSYFWAMIFIQDPAKHPLQIFLMRLLVQSQGSELGLAAATESLAIRTGIAEQIKYVVIVVTMAPILCVYPFAQKHFVKGVMIGSIKG